MESDKGSCRDCAIQEKYEQHIDSLMRQIKVMRNCANCDHEEELADANGDHFCDTCEDESNWTLGV